MGGVVLHELAGAGGVVRARQRSPVSGADLMLAYAVGFEAGVRTGRRAGRHRGLASDRHARQHRGGVAGGKLLGRPAAADRAMGIAAAAAGMHKTAAPCASPSRRQGGRERRAGRAAGGRIRQRRGDHRGPQRLSRIYSDVAAPGSSMPIDGGWLIETTA
jgi:hypothetical protein